MSDEPEYYSIHDQMRDLVLDTEKKIVEQPKMNELDDIRKSLKYILDKMTNMDRYIRSSQYRYGGRVMDGESYRQEVIKEFLLDMRSGIYSLEDMEQIAQGNFKLLTKES